MQTYALFDSCRAKGFARIVARLRVPRTNWNADAASGVNMRAKYALKISNTHTRRKQHMARRMAHGIPVFVLCCLRHATTIRVLCCLVLSEDN